MALTIDELNIQIAADSKNATRALTSLIKKLEKLKDTLNGSTVSNITISNSFNQTTNAINKTTTATQKHNNAVKKSSKSTKSFTDNLAQQISKWRTLLGVFQSAARTMGSWFKESNDYIETLNLFNVTMGDGAEEARKYAESVQNLMGIDIAEWMQYQGTFKQLTSGFGVASKEANVMSQNLTQLSYDMASFFNTDVETAFDKLSSAMSGQVKGLREFGIDTTVASLQEYALAKGIDTKVRSMTQAEKSLLRYNYIMEKSIIIQGDMARTIVTPANALRILSAQLTQMKRALGNVISVLVAKFIPYVQAMVEIITDAANALANFFGFELPKIDYSGLGGDMSSEFEDAEDSLDGVSGSLKKIKKQLMGFDELNIINNPDTDSGSGSGGAGGSLNGMKPLEYDFLKGLDTSKVDEIKQKLKDILGYLPVIAAGLAAFNVSKLITGLLVAKGLMGGLTAATIVIGATLAITGFTIEFKGIKDAIKNGLSKFNFGEIVGGALLGTGGATALGTAIVTWLGKVGSTKLVFALANLGKNLGVATTGALGAALGAGIGGIIAGIPMFITGIYDAIMSGINWLSGVLIPAGATAAGAGIGAIIGMLGGPIGAGIGALIGLIVGALTDIGILIYQKWDEICAFFAPVGDFFVGVAMWFYSNVIQPIINFFTPLVDAVVSIIALIDQKVTEIVDGIMKAVGAIFSKVWEIFLKIIEIFVALGKAAYTYIIKPIVDFVVDFAIMIYDKAIKPIVDFFVFLGKKAYEFVIKPIVDGVVWIYEQAVKIFKSIGTFVVEFISGLFKIVINGILAAIEGTVNLFIRMINGAVSAINLIPGVEITKLELLSIPRLAEGGIVNEGQMFIAREAGPELVGSIGRKTAVANNDQIISGIESGVYRAMMAANSTNRGGSQTIRIINEIDGDVVGEKVIQYHNGRVIQTGESPLLI